MEFKTEEIKSFPFLMVFIGAVFGIISYFINWFTIDGVSYSGLDLFNKVGPEALGSTDAWMLYIPLFVFVVSVIMLIIAILPLFGAKLNFGIVTGTFFLFGLAEIVGIIVLACNNSWVEGSQMFSFVQVGFWLAIVGAILVFAVALYNIKGDVVIVRKKA